MPPPQTRIRLRLASSACRSRRCGSALGRRAPGTRRRGSSSRPSRTPAGRSRRAGTACRRHRAPCPSARSRKPTRRVVSSSTAPSATSPTRTSWSSGVAVARRATSARPRRGRGARRPRSLPADDRRRARAPTSTSTLSAARSTAPAEEPAASARLTGRPPRRRRRPRQASRARAPRRAGPSTTTRAAPAARSRSSTSRCPSPSRSCTPTCGSRRNGGGYGRWRAPSATLCAFGVPDGTAERDDEVRSRPRERLGHVEAVAAVLVGDLGDHRAVERDGRDRVEPVEDEFVHGCRGELVRRSANVVSYVQSTSPIHASADSLSSRYGSGISPARMRSRCTHPGHDRRHRRGGRDRFGCRPGPRPDPPPRVKGALHLVHDVPHCSLPRPDAETARLLEGIGPRLVMLVREGGLEPPHPCEYWHLKPARLPIPPLAHVWMHRSASNHERLTSRGAQHHSGPPRPSRANAERMPQAPSVIPRVSTSASRSPAAGNSIDQRYRCPDRCDERTAVTSPDNSPTPRRLRSIRATPTSAASAAGSSTSTACSRPRRSCTCTPGRGCSRPFLEAHGADAVLRRRLLRLHRRQAPLRRGRGRCSRAAASALPRAR